ncbi:MAG TPA: VanW family protein, partial [Acidimicrobiales bacterium]|nr:VanW family protein [Acidimicrobiales bacterium]
PAQAEPDEAEPAQAEPDQAEPDEVVEVGGPVAGEATDAASGARRRRRALVAVPLLLVGLVVGAWAIDTATTSDQVLRNVEVAGRPVGGASEDKLSDTVSAVAADVAERPVTISAGDKTYETNAAAVGLTVDEEATAAAALDAGRDGFVLLRPLDWLGSLVSPHDVSPRYRVSAEQAAATLVLLQGADLHPAVEPTIRLGDDGFVAVPGQAGTGVDAAQVVRELPAAAAAAESPDGPIVVSLGADRVPPRFTDDQAEALAERANTMTRNGLSLRVDDTTVDVPAEQLRTWMGPKVTEAGRLDVALDGDAAGAALAELFSALAVAPSDATVTLVDGQPVVTPSQEGVGCCGDDAGSRIWQALSDGRTDVELHTEVTAPAHTTEEVQGWGITQPIGGNRGWRSGAEVPGPAPGFTTYHACCEPRVNNIHRMADLVRGAVIPPGGTFSINDYVGQRTTAKGFVPAGAIANGEHVQEVGGGVSQFATTTFNAAYFAGLDITESQAHSEYFSRYPRGREATMGFPAPDLALRNSTPYGMLIWTSYTDTSLTVTFYSTPWVTAEQTGIQESGSGGCRNVSTTRTRTYPDGTTKQDEFRATYRPGPGQSC